MRTPPGDRCIFVPPPASLQVLAPALENLHGNCARRAILDGETCSAEPERFSNYDKMLFRREWPFFLPFDLLAVDGDDGVGDDDREGQHVDDKRDVDDRRHYDV